MFVLTSFYNFTMFYFTLSVDILVFFRYFFRSLNFCGHGFSNNRKNQKLAGKRCSLMIYLSGWPLSQQAHPRAFNVREELAWSIFKTKVTAPNDGPHIRVRWVSVSKRPIPGNKSVHCGSFGDLMTFWKLDSAAIITSTESCERITKSIIGTFRFARRHSGLLRVTSI